MPRHFGLHFLSALSQGAEATSARIAPSVSRPAEVVRLFPLPSGSIPEPGRLPLKGFQLFHALLDICVAALTGILFFLGFVLMFVVRP